jgi:hypothetical protein
MKRSRLSFQVSINRAPRFDHLEWPRPRTPHLQSFKPRVQWYRRRKYIGLGLFIVFALGSFALATTGLSLLVGVWGIATLLACFLAACAVLLIGRRLSCPACGRKLEPAAGKYCPQCGSDEFQARVRKRTATGETLPYCPSCDSPIGEEDADSARSYWIRGCTHCGVLLDENGY